MGTTRNASDSGYPRLSCGHPLTPEPCAACHYKTPLLDDVWLDVAGVPLDLAGYFAESRPAMELWDLRSCYPIPFLVTFPLLPPCHSDTKNVFNGSWL